MKKWVKILLYVLFGILLLIGLGLGYVYYQVEGKYDINEDKYANYIGFLQNSNETPTFKRCDEEYTVGWFASAATYVPIFKGGKPNFRKYIRQNFEVANDSDNGFLNLRFIINCEGEVGNMEVNQLDVTYKPTVFSPKLVKQLVRLSSKKENWKVPIVKEKPRGSYMYLIYKIENGEIAEILP